jgi:hypothetical protein
MYHEGPLLPLPCLNRFLVGLIVAGVLPALAHVAAGSDVVQSEGGKERAQQIDDWVRQLDSNQFSQRHEASQQLESVGSEAIPALAAAAVGTSREVTLRSLDILRKHFGRDDQVLRAAAQAALEKIAASDHASAAQRAKDILDPPPPPAAAPGIRFALPQIQIQMNAVAGNQARRIQIKNGVKQTDITDGDRQIKIVDNPGGSIQLEVTEKKDGKQTTEKYEAKNADDLKKNHPEAHQLYQKYSQQMGPVVRIQAAQAQPGGVPANPAAPAPPANRAHQMRKMAATQLQHARRMIELSSRTLQQLAAGENGAQDLDKTLERLKKMAQQLEEEQAALNRAE